MREGRHIVCVVTELGGRRLLPAVPDLYATVVIP